MVLFKMEPFTKSMMKFVIKYDTRFGNSKIPLRYDISMFVNNRRALFYNLEAFFFLTRLFFLNWDEA